MKSALVLGGGGFIGGHLGKRLKDEGFYVRVADIKEAHEFFAHDIICHEYMEADLRDPVKVKEVMSPPRGYDGFDEVYQLAADMGGAGYVFTGENDANIMHNSAMINLNVAFEATHQKIGRVFYSSSACMYPEFNQLDPLNPNCKEDSAYPAEPDSEYGWEKLFSERLFLAFNRNYKVDVRVARFHNIFGPMGSWTDGKEKAPAAMCRKVAEASDGDSIEVWGTGAQTRSFLYIDDCLEGVIRFMRQEEFMGPVNIGSEEMVTINELAQMAIDISGKNLSINNIEGKDFFEKYGFQCPIGVMGRNSDNALYEQKMHWKVSKPLIEGMTETYHWINEQVKKKQPVN
jgi:GDP-D-mannose 3',5'-epimerase